MKTRWILIAVTAPMMLLTGLSTLDRFSAPDAPPLPYFMLPPALPYNWAPQSAIKQGQSKHCDLSCVLPPRQARI
jgi:hypothetical protein